MGANITDMDGFELGKPALVCRWRIYNRHLPIENRHMRALLARRIGDKAVPKELVAWAKQHIEWTLEQGAASNPNGTLMLIVDEQGRAAMTVGPFVPLEDVTLKGLARRSVRSHQEALSTGIAPETLWLVRKDLLMWDPGEDCEPSGSASLVGQLARTLGLGVQVIPNIERALADGNIRYDEGFLVSDEHGVVPAHDATGTHGNRFAQGYHRLLLRS